MLLSMGTLAVILLVSIGLLALGLEAYKQNRPLFQALREGKQNIHSTLWQAWVVWRPMAVVITILLGIACAISWGITELAYRYTTLDEFCEVSDLESPLYIACTGMGNELAANKIRQLSAREDMERQLFRRYRDLRKQYLSMPVHELREKAKDPFAFKKSLLPAGVLGLPPSIEDDVTLSGLLTNRRRVAQSPIPNPTDIIELLSYRQSVDTRNRILHDLDVKISARRIALHAAEYDQLTPEQIRQHDQRNRVLSMLKAVDINSDPAIQTRLLTPENMSTASIDFVRKRIVRSLAHSERDAWKILSREIATPAKAAVVYDLLDMVPECTIAEANSALRFNSSDFNPKFPNLSVAEAATFSTDNAGSFPCLPKHGVTGNLKLVSVGFRRSVFFSIDRLSEDAAFNAFKKLETLERNTALGATDAKTAMQEAANAVPAVIPLGRQDCGLFHPANCAMNILADSVEAAYTRSRNDMVKRQTQAADAKIATSAMTIQQSIDQARVTADAEVDQMHSTGYAVTESLFKFNSFLRMMGWIILLVLVSRSFLYVFALELFDRDGELRISFDVKNPVEGSVVSGSVITIDRDFPFPIINRGSLTNTLADIKFAPWKWSAPIARILQGRYFLFNWSVFSPPNQSSGAEDVKGMEASARSGFSIVEWRMQPGEEVIFHYRDFYGASNNLQLRTDFSLRLSTLLLGKVFFHYARCVGGEGRLLLEARVHKTAQVSISSVKPSRMIAWSRHAQFTADSHRQAWKTFINPFTIVRESSPGLARGILIIAPESESPQFFGIGIRFFKRIISRIF